VASLCLDCTPKAPSDARRWAADLLKRTFPDLEDAARLIGDALLCVSELVTNAVTAGCSQVTLRIEPDRDELKLAISDDAPGLPELTRAALDAFSGRGLAIVEAISAAWGVRDSPAGKEVWVRLQAAF
jgi:anti-sigma regulatory factor (Ser/Thr protein kinase)